MRLDESADGVTKGLFISILETDLCRCSMGLAKLDTQVCDVITDNGLSPLFHVSHLVFFSHILSWDYGALLRSSAIFVQQWWYKNQGTRATFVFRRVCACKRKNKRRGEGCHRCQQEYLISCQRVSGSIHLLKRHLMKLSGLFLFVTGPFDPRLLFLQPLSLSRK